MHADAGREAYQKICSFWQRKHVQYFLIKFAKYLMLKACWLWFVILKKYVELTRPKIESRDPISFTGARARSRVSGNDRLFPRGSEFGPNLEIPAGPAIQLRPRPVVNPALTADPALTPYYSTADRSHSGNIWLVLNSAKIYFDMKKKKIQNFFQCVYHVFHISHFFLV